MAIDIQAVCTHAANEHLPAQDLAIVLSTLWIFLTVAATSVAAYSIWLFSDPPKAAAPRASPPALFQ